MTRTLAAFAAMFVLASPAFAQGPTRATEINVDLTPVASRAEAEALYPQMSAHEIDVLLHRICEMRSMAKLDF